VLQTLFDMRLDLEELRREFDTFRSRGESVEGLSEYDLARYAPARVYSPARRLSPPPTEPEPASAAEDSPAAVDAADADAIVFREGMTMQELERRAIELALKRFGGNRRKAAEALEIGERTLYRKIKEYGLEA
jgi:DNA-binding NtrC family response regulator